MQTFDLYLTYFYCSPNINRTILYSFCISVNAWRGILQVSNWNRTFVCSSSGTPINKRPVLGYRNLNLFKLYRLVHKLGGFDNVSAFLTASPLPAVAPWSHSSHLMWTDSGSVSVSTFEQIESGSVWKQVYQDLGIPVLNSAAGYNVKCAYRKYVQMLPPQLLQAFVFAVLCPCRCLSYIRYPHIVLLSLQRPVSIARCNGTCISLTKTVLAFFPDTCMDLRSTAPPLPSPSGWTSL